MKNLNQLRAVIEPTEQDHLDMIRQPDYWPIENLLPLKNKKRGLHGFILKSSAPGYRVYVGNMFFVVIGGRQVVNEMNHENYMSADAIVDAGWEVD